MDKTLTIGRTYAVTTASECTVTDADGKLLCTAYAGHQNFFIATTSAITFSDDAATVTAVFNLALAGGSVRGGGVTPEDIEAAQKAAYDAATAAAQANSAAAEAAAAAELLGNAVIETENNVFTGTNTFNGAVALNGAVSFAGEDLSKSLLVPSMLELAAKKWNPFSGEAETFAEWETMNPDWESREELVLYAPKITGGLPSRTTRNSVTSAIIITSGSGPSSSSGNGTKNYGAENLTFITYASSLGGFINCYSCSKLYVYAPAATSAGNNCFGYLNALGDSGMDVLLYLPNITKINSAANGMFSKWGKIASLKCYMPNCVTMPESLGASAETANTCEIWTALIAGLGTPATVQNIKIYTPPDANEVGDTSTGQTKFDALQAYAATKNWAFTLI